MTVDGSARLTTARSANVSRTYTVLVCGSRDWDDEQAIREELAYLVGRWRRVRVIHGAAMGADQLAAHHAERLGLRVEAFPANWERDGKKAGILRNLKMLDQCPDEVLAFRVNGSRGTTHTIEAARKRNIPVRVVGA